MRSIFLKGRLRSQQDFKASHVDHCIATAAHYCMRASLRQAGAGRCGGSTGWLRHSGVASAPSERRIGLQHQDIGDNETGSLRLEVFASAIDCATSDCASLSHGHAWGTHGAGGLGWTSGRAARGSRGFSGCSAWIWSRRGSPGGCLVSGRFSDRYRG